MRPTIHACLVLKNVAVQMTCGTVLKCGCVFAKNEGKKALRLVEAIQFLNYVGSCATTAYGTCLNVIPKSDFVRACKGARFLFEMCSRVISYQSRVFPWSAKHNNNGLPLHTGAQSMERS